jgi:hypothetical protein
MAWVVINCPAAAHAQADKGMIQDRNDRLEMVAARTETQQKAQTEIWPAAKILLNLEARCPVATTLGYFGAQTLGEPDPAKAADELAHYAELQKAAQPLAGDLQKMGTNAFTGTKFPAALEPQLNALRARLYDAVLKIYGPTALQGLQQYVAAMSQGAIKKSAP